MSQKNSVFFSATSQFNDFLSPPGHGRSDDCSSFPGQPNPEGEGDCPEEEEEKTTDKDKGNAKINATYVELGQTQSGSGECSEGDDDGPPIYVNPVDLSSVDRPADPGGGPVPSSASFVTPPNLMPETAHDQSPEQERQIWTKPLTQDSPNVAAATGEMTWEEVDFSLPGPGPSFVLKRTYKSGLAGYQSIYGLGWEMSVHRWVRLVPTNDRLYVTTGRGPVKEYVEETDGSTWYVRESAKDMFEFVAAAGGDPDTFTRYEPSGNRETFQRLDPLEDYFYVTRYEDLSGNFMSFHYEDASGVNGFPTSKRLYGIVDTLGRTVRFSYNGPDAVCITDIEIEDWNGQLMGTIEYVYEDVSKNGLTYRTLVEVIGLEIGTEGTAGAWQMTKPVRKYEYDWAVVTSSSLDLPLLSRVRSPRANQPVTYEWHYVDPWEGSGWEVKKQVENPGSTHEATHEYFYQPNLVAYVGPHGYRTDFQKIPGTQRISVRKDYLDQTGNNTAITRWEYDSTCGCGRVQKVIHPDGMEQHYEYDEYGNVVIEWLKEAGGSNYRLQKFAYSIFDPRNGLYFSRLTQHELWRDAGTETPGNACSSPGCHGGATPPGQIVYEYSYNNLGLLERATYGSIADRTGSSTRLLRSQEFFYPRDIRDGIPRLSERFDKLNGTIVKLTEYIYGNQVPLIKAVVSPNAARTKSWTTSYTRNSWGRILTIAGETGVVKKLRWDPAGYLLAVYDDWNAATQSARHTIKSYYDLSGWRLKRVRSSEGLSETTEYLRDDGGFFSEFRFTGSQGITKSSFFEYAPDGKLLKTTSWNGQVLGTDYGFGVYRLPVKIWRELQDPGGNVLSTPQDIWLAGDGAGDAGYDKMGRPTSSRNALGWKSYFTYDGFSRLSQSWTQTHAAESGHDELYDITRWQFNPRGFVNQIDSGRAEGAGPGNLQNLGWEVEETITPNTVGNVLLHSVSIAGDPSPARLTTFIVDGFGRIKEWQRYFGDRTQAINNASYINQKLDYNSIGQVIQMGTYDSSGVQLAKTSIDYRESVREYEVIIEEGERSWKALTHKDTLGRPIQTTIWNLGETKSKTITKGYDGFGRIVAQVDPMGLRREWDYDQYGRVIVDRLVPMVAGGGPNTPKETRYSWDANTGVLISVTDAEGKVTSFTYHDDRFRLLEQTAYADGRFEKVNQYDALDRPLQTQDSRGVIHDYTYDFQRLVRDDANPGMGNAAVGPDALEWIFDAASNDLIETRTLDAQNNLLWKTQYQVNALGELLRETQGPSGLEHTWNWARGYAGELHAVDYPAGLGIAKGILSYDDFGHLGSVTYENAIQSTLAHYVPGYEGARFVSREETVSQTRLEFDFDVWGRMNEIEWGTISNGFGALEGSYQSYDHAGRVIAKQRLTETTGEVFEHDSYGRLKAWYQGVSNALQHVPGNPPSTWTEVERYTLDKVYAREQVEVEVNGGTTTTSHYSTDDAHFYTAIDGLVRTKEGGHLASDGTYAYAYDAWGHLITVNDQQTNTLLKTHTYDAEGRRVRTVHHMPSPDVVERLVYWGSRLAATYDEASQEARTYGYVGGADGEAFVQITGSASYDGTYHLIRNFQGSVIALADADGTLLESYAYTAFGKPTITDVSTGQTLTESACGFNRFFLGRPYDSEVGLYDLRARWYQAETGSFLSPDPLGAIDSWNLYQYGFGTPNTWIDPTGLAIDFLKGVAVGVGQGGWALVKGIAGGAWNLVRHPIKTSGAIKDGVLAIKDAAAAGDFEAIATMLAPELVEGLKNWDSLSEYEQGKLAGKLLAEVGGSVAGLAKLASKLNKLRKAKKAKECKTSPRKEPELELPGSEKTPVARGGTLQGSSKKFGKHRIPDRPGYRTPEEYRVRAQEIFRDPNATRTTFPSDGSKYAGETHIQVRDELLRLDPQGNFRSLYVLDR